VLILKLKRQQAATIGVDITVRVLGISDGWVKLGITAPPGVEIERAVPELETPQEQAEAA
jgi:carbon storage regulator CsrA